jgi:hypothetical protein
MANRFPIIYNPNANQLQEIASGDDLDLSGNSIINLVVVGVATATRFISTQTTGTAPFIVSSTTKVNNLNADLLDGYNTASTNTVNTVVIRDESGNFSAETITANSYNVGTAVGISTTITTVATTAATTIDSFAVASFRSARIQIQITQSTDYQASDILVIHNGTTASFIEYGSIATNAYLGTLSVTISGENVLTQVGMTSTTSATVKVLSQKITV